VNTISIVRIYALPESQQCGCRHRERAPATSAFHPTPDISLRRNESTLRAMCGRLRVGKGFFHECSIGRCSHVFGLCVRFT
jgi:hypothetical protein